MVEKRHLRKKTPIADKRLHRLDSIGPAKSLRLSPVRRRREMAHQIKTCVNKRPILLQDKAVRFQVTRNVAIANKTPHFLLVHEFAHERKRLGKVASNLLQLLMGEIKIKPF